MAAGKSLRILPGLLILALGLALLLHNLDVLDLGGLRVFWPLAIAAFGLHLFFDGKNRALGAVITVVGAALQADNLGWVDVRWRRLFDFWPLILIGLGAQMLVRSAKDNAVGGVLLVGLGTYFLGRNFDLFYFNVWDLWPVAIIAAGIAMIMKARRGG